MFAKVTPTQKARIVRALRANGEVVGFLADGANDTIALREADVGISVDGAVDIARDAADIILLEKDLTVLGHGVLEGRRTLANTMKYVKASASSNFGNALSIVLALGVPPFLPMLPIQLLVQNLTYDLAQLALPWDRVDADYLRRPRRWIAGDLSAFMLLLGPVSSVFDLATFAVLLWVFRAPEPLFQAGWFAEGLVSQILVVLVIRTHRLRGGARPSKPVLIVFAVAVLFGLSIVFTPAAVLLHLHPLPLAYLPWLAAIVTAYCACVRCDQTQLIRHAPTNHLTDRDGGSENDHAGNARPPGRRRRTRRPDRLRTAVPRPDGRAAHQRARRRRRHLVRAALRARFRRPVRHR